DALFEAVATAADQGPVPVHREILVAVFGRVGDFGLPVGSGGVIGTDAAGFAGEGVVDFEVCAVGV
ncbi:MAG: hypothetical protein OXI59_00710, partial [Gemmatimonadota bacterium]|nr:hypothetical protein [Gemmatimonadota bacterium]